MGQPKQDAIGHSHHPGATASFDTRFCTCLFHHCVIAHCLGKQNWSSIKVLSRVLSEKRSEQEKLDAADVFGQKENRQSSAVS